MTVISQCIRATVLFGVMVTGALSQTAQLTGTVTDPSGSVVPGAKVVATNIDTGVARASVANDRGNYLVTTLLPGKYKVVTESPGFKQVSREGVTLAIDQVARIDFILEVGETRDTVSVEATGVILDAATSTLGNVVETRQIAELPLNGRNPLDLIALSPGIRVQGGFGGKTGSWGNFSSNGGLANASSVMVEGLALDLAQMNSPSFVPPVDATQEFRVQTSNFSAEFGRTAGAVVNFSIKSGTNQIHGSAYEFLRNKALNANDFFQNRAGNTRAPLVRNQFGGSIGGPIRKDKTFFFGNWEEYRNRQISPSITTVPTDLQRVGNFSQTRNAAGNVILIADPTTTRQLPDGTYTRDVFQGNIIPADRFSKVAANIAQVWPKANTAGNPLTGVNNFRRPAEAGLRNISS